MVKAGGPTSTHDFTLDDGTTLKGFMLRRNPKGKRGFKLTDANPIAPRIYTQDEITQAGLNHQYAQYAVQNNWERGLGGKTHGEPRDALKLADATMIDASVRGILRPARHTNAATVDNNPTEFVPSGFAAGGDEVHAFVGRFPYIWDWTNKEFDRQSAPVAAERLYRNAINFSGQLYAPSWADGQAIGVTFDAASSDSEDLEQSSFSFSHTVGTGLNRLLIVGVSTRTIGSAVPPTGVTYGGVAMTQIGTSVENGGFSTTMWYLVAPATGANTVAVSAGSNWLRIIVGAVSFHGANQDVPVGTPVTDTDTATSISVDVSVSNPGHGFVIDTLTADGDATVGADQTERWNIRFAGSTGGSGSTEPTTAITTMSWTLGGLSQLALMAVEVFAEPTQVDIPVNYIHKTPAATTFTLVDGVGSTDVDSFKYFTVANGLLWGGHCVHWADSTTNTNEALDATETDVDVVDGTQFTAGDVARVESELMLVVSIATNTLTVVRGYRGSVAATHDTGKDVYKATTNVHHVHSTTDGTTLSSWSTATAVGDTSSEIVALIGVDTDLLVCKTDNVYRLEADGTVTALLASTKYAPHPDQFRGAYYWSEKGVILLPTHEGGLLVMDATTFAVHDISFTLSMPEITTLHGQIVAFTSDYDKLYCLVLDSDNTRYHLLMATFTPEDGPTAFYWHHLTQISYTTGTDAAHAALLLEGITDDDTGDTHHRVWVGIESTGSNLLPYWIAHDDHDVDASFTNDSDAVAQYPAFDKGLPHVEAILGSVDFETRNLGAAGRQFAVEHRLDGGSWLTTLTDSAGNADGILDVSDFQTLTFPDYTTAKLLEIRAKPSSTGQTTTAPEIRNVRVTWYVATTALRVLPAAFHLADNQMQYNGVKSRDSASGTRTKLLEWSDGAVELTVTDPTGTERTMRILPGTLVIEETANEIARHPEYDASLFLAET